MVDAALPKVGKHRAWIDHVVEGVLCAIIDAYRVRGQQAKPFWRGPAYQLNRHELAVILDCRPRDISTALVFLEKHELVTVHRKARYVGGEPRGRMVYVIPNVDGIDWMLTEIERAGSQLAKKADEDADEDVCDDVDDKGAPPTDVPDSCTPGGEVQHSTPAESGTQPVEVRHNNLNVPNRHNDDVGRAARQLPHNSTSIRSQLPRSAAGGGGAADAGSTSPQAPDRSAKTAPAPTSSPAHNGQGANGPASDVLWRRPKVVESRISHFIYFWSEAGRRSRHLDLITVASGDREALKRFFTAEDKHSGYLAAASICAWQAGNEVKKKGKYDPAWVCRRAKDIQTFLRLRCRILSELGANGYEVNACKDLRLWFTDSELREQGFPIKLGLNVASSDECWENNPDAPGYYREHGIEMPPEVHAASTYRHNEEAKSVI